MKVKVCTKCKIEKSLDEFGLEKKVKDGKQSRCKQCINNSGKKYRTEHKEEIKIRRKNNYKNYREKTRSNKNKYYHKICKKDIGYRINSNLRTRIWYVIKNNRKSASALKLLGCSIDYLKLHLQSQFTEGMTWDNYGK